MPLKAKKKRSQTPVPPRRRKATFQADLAASDEHRVRLLKQELQLASNTDFFADAVALFHCAVSERKLGHRILSESPSGDRKVLVLPGLERVAPDLSLPRIEIQWTESELAALAKLASSPEASPPTPALIRALRD